MSKKRKNIMDGYFDQFRNEQIDVNPHVQDLEISDSPKGISELGVSASPHINDPSSQELVVDQEPISSQSTPISNQSVSIDSHSIANQESISSHSEPISSRSVSINSQNSENEPFPLIKSRLVVDQDPISSHSTPISSQSVSINSHSIANQESICSHSVPISSRSISINSQNKKIPEKQINQIKKQTKTESVVDQESFSSRSIADRSSINSRLVSDEESINSRSVPDQYLIDSQIDDAFESNPNIDIFLKSIGTTKLSDYLGDAQYSLLNYVFLNTNIQTFQTGMLTRKTVATNCNISDNSVQSTIQKLCKLGVIKRGLGKSGNGGKFQLKIHKKIYQKLITDNKTINSRLVADQKSFSVPLVPDQLSAVSSKLVSNINNNLLTSTVVETEEDLNALDVSAINIDQLKNTSISRKQIQDIKNQRLNFTTETLQDFVDRFAIYTSDSKNIANIKSIPAIFVKMAQLASKGQDPLIDIETDTDRLIRERLERLRAIKEERLKQRQELLELEFENWLEEIDLDQVEKIAPATSMMKQGSVAQKMTLKNYFVENVWNQKTGNLFFNQPEI
jgi:hypothetical protein